MDIEALNQQTRSTVESWGGESRFVESDGGYWEVSFPATEESEYRFVAHLFTDGEVQIHAVRSNAPEAEYFWYKPYEEPDYDSLESMHGTFLSELKPLLTHKTRITHKKGLLFGSFTCEFRDREAWRSIGGTSYFRYGGFKPPRAGGRRQQYQSGVVRGET